MKVFSQKLDGDYQFQVGQKLNKYLAQKWNNAKIFRQILIPSPFNFFVVEKNINLCIEKINFTQIKMKYQPQ